MFIMRKLISKADGNIFRDPYPENMQRVTDLGTLILHGMSPTNSYPQGSGNFIKECKCTHDGRHQGSRFSTYGETES